MASRDYLKVVHLRFQNREFTAMNFNFNIYNFFLIKEAFEAFKRGTDEDKKKNYRAAVWYYERGMEKFLTTIKCRVIKSKMFNLR
jgi:hypothetical protein